MKDDSSEKSAARFLKSYADRRRQDRRVLARRRHLVESGDTRYVLNVAAATLDELKAALDEKIARYHDAGVEDPPHITVIARQMLDEARPVRVL